MVFTPKKKTLSNFFLPFISFWKRITISYSGFSRFFPLHNSLHLNWKWIAIKIFPLWPISRGEERVRERERESRQMIRIIVVWKSSFFFFMFFWFPPFAILFFAFACIHTQFASDSMGGIPYPFPSMLFLSFFFIWIYCACKKVPKQWTERNNFRILPSHSPNLFSILFILSPFFLPHFRHHQNSFHCSRAYAGRRVWKKVISSYCLLRLKIIIIRKKKESLRCKWNSWEGRGSLNIHNYFENVSSIWIEIVFISVSFFVLFYFLFFAFISYQNSYQVEWREEEEKKSNFYNIIREDW